MQIFCRVKPNFNFGAPKSLQPNFLIDVLTYSDNFFFCIFSSTLFLTAIFITVSTVFWTIIIAISDNSKINESLLNWVKDCFYYTNLILRGCATSFAHFFLRSGCGQGTFDPRFKFSITTAERTIEVVNTGQRYWLLCTLVLQTEQHLSQAILTVRIYLYLLRIVSFLSRSSQ